VAETVRAAQDGDAADRQTLLSAIKLSRHYGSPLEPSDSLGTVLEGTGLWTSGEAATPIGSSLARRLSRFLDEMDLLQEHEARGLSATAAVSQPKSGSRLGHIAVWRGGLETEQGLRALNETGVSWAFLEGGGGASIAVFEPDPSIAFQAIARFLASGGSRLAIGIVAAQITLTVTGLDIKIASRGLVRAQTIAGVALPGQILVADPVDPSFTPSILKAYGDQLGQIRGADLRCERFGRHVLVAGSRFDNLWCVMSDELGLHENRAGAQFRIRPRNT
jgi:hypothetical protein